MLKQSGFRPTLIGLSYPLALLLFLASRFLRTRPELLEALYPARANRFLIRILSRTTGVFPFSLGEVLLLLHVLLLLWILYRLVVGLLQGGALRLLYQVGVYLSLLYVVFMMVFGLNYLRPSLRQDLSMVRTLYGVEELERMNRLLLEQARALRMEVAEDGEGVFRHFGDGEDVLLRAEAAFHVLGETVPAFQGTYGRPKGILLSQPMLHTGITGVFMPFTGEANVNMRNPSLYFPATVLHEMAHQRGIAYEDEANFLAYLASRHHPDADFRYSGTMLALNSGMNALFRADRERHAALRADYSPGMDRDVRAYSAFHRAYQGRVNDTATRVNDNYLRSQGQTAGVRSYGMMVDLLLEFYEQLEDGARFRGAPGS